MSEHTEGERTEPRRREYPTGGVLNEVYRDHEDIALNHLSGADIAFIEYLDAWIDKGLADGTLTIEKGARYREAIAARCAELGEVPHVREHMVALQLKAGDILGIVAPSESSNLMSSMARYARELLKLVGAEGVEVLVFPPGTEFHVLKPQPVAEQPTVHVQIHGGPDDGSAATSARIRAVMAEEVRRNALYGRGQL